MKPRSLLRAAVPVVIAAAALLARERTRVPFAELPPPGSARVFAPPAELVSAALGSGDGDYRVAPARDGWLTTPDSDSFSELYRPVRIRAGSLRVDEGGGARLSLDLEIAGERLRGPLPLRFQPAALRASVVPGVRSAELSATVARQDDAVGVGAHLHLIALGHGAARALLIAELKMAGGVGLMVLELSLEQP